MNELLPVVKFAGKQFSKITPELEEYFSEWKQSGAQDETFSQESRYTHAIVSEYDPIVVDDDSHPSNADCQLMWGPVKITQRRRLNLDGRVFFIQTVVEKTKDTRFSPLPFRHCWHTQGDPCVLDGPLEEFISDQQ